MKVVVVIGWLSCCQHVVVVGCRQGSACDGSRVSSGVGMWWGCCHYSLSSVVEVVVMVVLE